jgi:hypothetical protein
MLSAVNFCINNYSTIIIIIIIIIIIVITTTTTTIDTDTVHEVGGLRPTRRKGLVSRRPWLYEGTTRLAN